jgi:hypothetical protein
MHLPVAQRSAPDAVDPALDFGNWLAFAVACQWISDLDYVFCPGGGSDMFPYYMTEDGTGVQIRAATVEQLRDAQRGEPMQGVPDPVVPVRQIRAEEFRVDGAYDAIVLCRSPGYTPASADAIFDLIRHEFIDELG